MGQSFRCPNPICSHIFGEAQIAGAASVSCPICGMVAQFRTPTARPESSSTAPTVAVTAAPPRVPMAQPVKSIPIAQAVAPKPPPEAVQTTRPLPVPVPHESDLRTPIVRTRNFRRSRDWFSYPVAFGIFFLLCALTVVGYFVTQRTSSGVRGHEGGYIHSDYNFSFDPKNSKWQDNLQLKNRVGSQIALQRAEPTAYFAISVMDFRDHNPSPRELDDEARTKLRDLFPKNVETDPGRDAAPQTTDKVAGQTTYRIIFEGQSEDEASSGEVVFFANQGLGYWLYTWAPTTLAKDLAEEFRGLRKNFTLLGERQAWKQIQQHREEFEGDKIKGYRLVDTSGRWRKEDSPKEHDPDADLVLHADPPKPGLPAQGADLVVMSLPSGKDPIEQATEHIIRKHVREGNPDTKIEETYAAGEAAKDHVGEAKGHLLQWRIDNGPGRERFAVVGIIPRSGDTLVLYAECDMARRFSWEVQMRQLVESVQIKD